MNELIATTESTRPLLSICVPTFNNADRVFKLVSNILTSTESEFEIIVLDNCSTDNTKQTLSTISDVRFSYVENDINIGGIINPIKILTLSKGKYAFLCLDKDIVKPESIGRIIEILKANPDVVFGRSGLNLEVEKACVTYEKGYRSIEKMAYLSAHPTGNFYLSSLYKNLSILDEIYTNKRKFGFYFDLINAQMALLGKSLLINSPCFYTQTKDERVETRSYTYVEKDAYFLPSQRIIEFDSYVDDAVKLNLSKSELLKLAGKLYMRMLFLSTLAYKQVMNDATKCTHYGVVTKNISFSELVSINNRFAQHFWHSKIGISRLFKAPIIFCGFLKFLVNLLYQNNGILNYKLIGLGNIHHCE